MGDDRESPSAGWREVYREMDADPSAEEPTHSCPDCGRTCRNLLRDVYECDEHGVFRASARGSDESATADSERRETGDAESPDDLLSILLTAAGPDGTTMDDDVVRDQMVTFLFAGHETTALALTYAWHLLGRNPETLDRLRAELDAELGDRSATMADLPALDYTEQVVNETLRLFPPAYALFREPTEDVQVGSYRVREGTAMTIPIFKLHRDGRFYDAPDEFRPERWTDEFEAELPEYAYLPFGGGPRHCIGMRFALAELKLVLATLAREVAFDPTYDGDPDLSMAATMRPDQPMRMRVRRRD